MATLTIVKPNGDLKYIELSSKGLSYHPKNNEKLFLDGKLKDYSFNIVDNDLL